MSEDVFLRNSGDIASILRNAVQERGISTAELARRIGSDRKRLWYVLNGQREMRVDEFLKLCVALRLDPCSFVTKDMVEGIAAATKGKRKG
ncbi:helix-turn-helix domain-containing protein [Eggerthella timonensis]|uniref:helix-turn-helix domain-containing protein n=1 Tax=Eggerthella timonensis TaxID=1871008 RepID=UPI001FE2A873|nr:helix-turn-helix transcriptional regulator [Eggerthella timonensis]